MLGRTPRLSKPPTLGTARAKAAGSALPAAAAPFRGSGSPQTSRPLRGWSPRRTRGGGLPQQPL
eukprot:2265218-Prorocentrum_lima.AAC.1